MKKPTEILLNYDEATYHSRPEISKSNLDQFMVSPLNYWYHNINEDKPIRKATKSMEIGSIVHKIALEGEEAFAKDYAQPPKDGVKKPTSAQLNAKKPSEATVKQIALWEDYIKENEGKTPVDAKDLIVARKCVSSLDAHPVASEVLSSIENPEVTIIYDANGLEMRSRLDGVTKGGAIVDLKTAQDASPKGFKSSFYKYNYGLQAYTYSLAFYEAYGAWPKEFYFVVVETSAPYHTAIYTVPAPSMDYWKTRFNSLTREFQECLKTNRWPGLNDDLITVLPIE